MEEDVGCFLKTSERFPEVRGCNMLTGHVSRKCLSGGVARFLQTQSDNKAQSSQRSIQIREIERLT